MAELGRNDLKQKFETGDRPSELDFVDLIDSAANIADDGEAGETYYWGIFDATDLGAAGLRNKFIGEVTAAATVTLEETTGVLMSGGLAGALSSSYVVGARVNGQHAGAATISGYGLDLSGATDPSSTLTLYGVGVQVNGPLAGSDIAVQGGNAISINTSVASDSSVSLFGSTSGCLVNGDLSESSGVLATGKGHFVTGYAYQYSVISTVGSGNTASGYASNYGYISSSGTGSTAIGSAYKNGHIDSTSQGSFASGYTYGGYINASSKGSSCLGHVYNSGKIETSGNGALAAGYANNSGYIIASNDGSLSVGYAYYYGVVEANADGATAHGHASYYGEVKSSADGSLAVGYAKDYGSITATGKGSLVGGSAVAVANTSSGNGSLVWGTEVSSVINSSIVAGKGLSLGAGAPEGSARFGSFNTTAGTASAFPFVVGIGTGDVTRADGFAVSSTGELYAANATINTGIDYAESFEWNDGNVDDEDRVGLLVTFVGNKIEKAAPGDRLAGIISATPNVIGDEGAMGWKDRYLKDDFGRVQYHEVTTPDILYKWNDKKEQALQALKESLLKVEEDIAVKATLKEELEELKKDPEANEEAIKTCKESIAALKVFKKKGLEAKIKTKEDNKALEGTIKVKGSTTTQPILNPDYDPDAEYIPRKDRKEWSNVGLLGQLRVKDDNTANPGDLIVSGENGIATKSSDDTGYVVLQRIKEGIIQVLVK